jgi:hypothetical protein
MAVQRDFLSQGAVDSARVWLAIGAEGNVTLFADEARADRLRAQGVGVREVALPAVTVAPGAPKGATA